MKVSNDPGPSRLTLSLRFYREPHFIAVVPDERAVSWVSLQLSNQIVEFLPERRVSFQQRFGLAFEPGSEFNLKAN